jgi:hypothetical protein
MKAEGKCPVYQVHLPELQIETEETVPQQLLEKGIFVEGGPGGSSKYKWKNKPADKATSRISSLAQL